MSVQLGSVVEGVVTGITDFGAFVELPGGQTGLVHISEIAEVYVKNINDFLKKDERVKVKVISIEDNGKIGLSIKQADPKSSRRSAGKRTSPSFEEKLARFLKESDERQQHLRRSYDAKRGGRGSSRKIE